jgi:F-type H+-transporting ATPase subunit delta
MVEPTTIARPYAEAVFRLAGDAGRFAEWSSMLAELAAVTQDARIEAVIGDPRVPHGKLAGLILSILSGRLSGEAENFVRVLAENHRLAVLPEIRAQYDALRNAREGVLEADIYTAFELAPDQLAELVARLEKKTGRKVKARTHVDRELIGGVKMMIGDKVIDGSARAQLAALEAALKA